MRRVLEFILFFHCFLLALFCTALAEDNVIHIWNGMDDTRYYYAEAKTKERYPDISVQLEQSWDSRELINRMFSQDQGIDIICFQDWNNGMSGRYLMQSGVLCDLNTIPALREKKTLLNSMHEMYTLDGQWFGVQSTILMYVWYGNNALFQKLGLELPDKEWTWDDFYELGCKVHDYNEKNGTQYKLIYENDTCPYAVRQYLYHTTDYARGTHHLSDGYFRKVVAQWLQLRKWNVHYDCGDADVSLEMNTIEDTLLVVKRTGFGASDLVNVDPEISADAEDVPYKAIYPPTMEGVKGALARGFAMGITSYSKLREEAAYFLECYLSFEAYEDELGLWKGMQYADNWTTPFWNNGPMYLEDPILERLSLPVGSWAEENLNYWLALLENLEGEYYDPDMAHTVCYAFDDGLGALKEGKISLDEYIKNCCRIADQYLGE